MCGGWRATLVKPVSQPASVSRESDGADLRGVLQIVSIRVGIQRVCLERNVALGAVEEEVPIRVGVQWIRPFSQLFGI